jgi:cytochrome P450
METITLTDYKQCEAALRNTSLKQALYDAGKVITEGTLLVLHGEEHLARRQLEFKVFQRGFLRYYEQDLFPQTLRETLAPFLALGRADLIEFGYRVTINLTADFSGIDRPEKSVAETEALLAHVKSFSEGATLVHSTRPKADVEAEVRTHLAAFDAQFLKPSIARRQAMLAQVANGSLAEDALPRDILTVLLRNEDRLDLPYDLLLREMAFFMQAGSHSTSNAMTHSMHEIFTWAGADTARWARVMGEPFFLQKCVHESLRLHPASPEAWRRPVCPVHIGAQQAADESHRIILDLFNANRQQSIFGSDAEAFNPDRTTPVGVQPFGLTFGIGVHTCLGRDIDGGLVARAESDPATHQYGVVTQLVRALLDAGARPIADDPPRADPKTSRPNWGYYPVGFSTKH